MAAATAMIAAGQMGLNLGAAYSGSKDIKAQGEMKERLANVNARYMEMNAADAIERGNSAIAQSKRDNKKLAGAQRTALAAQGITIDSGSALDVQMDTADFAAEEARTIKTNAFREAWGYKVQALNATAEGRIAKAESIQNARNTMLTGAAKAGANAQDMFSTKGKSGGSSGGGSAPAGGG